MAHYSPERGWISRPRRSGETGPDAYDPSSNHFAERNRQTETELPGGLVRIDLGEPVKRLPSEVLRSKTAKADPPSACADPLPDPSPTPVLRSVAPPRPRRDPWGLNRDED